MVFLKGIPPDGPRKCGETKYIRVCSSDCLPYGDQLKEVKVIRDGSEPHMVKNFIVKSEARVVLMSKITGAELKPIAEQP